MWRSRLPECCLVVALLAGAITALAEQTPLRLGSVAMDIPAVMHRRLQPLTEYLAGRLGQPVRLQLSPDMPAAIEQIASQQVDLAYLTPVAYLRAHDRGDARLVVKTLTKGQGFFRLMIVVPESSPIQSVEELAGKRFAFGDRAALLQQAVLLQAGLPLEALGDYRFIGHYDNIVRAVLNRDFDAGILKDTMAYAWQGRGIRIIHTSSELPPYNIAARRDLPDELLQSVRQAFLDLDPADPQHRRVIEALDPAYDGFTEAEDAEYDEIRHLLGRLSAGAAAPAAGPQ